MNQKATCHDCVHVRRIWRGITPRWVCTLYRTAATQRCIDWKQIQNT